MGYELYCELSIDPHNGLPVAPVEVETETADGLLSTRQAGFQEKVPCHVDRIVGTMRAEESWNLPVKCLHTIDREADSVGYFMEWYSAGIHFPVRSDDRSVRLGRLKIKFSRIDITNMVEKRYVHAGKAEYEGRAVIVSGTSGGSGPVGVPLVARQDRAKRRHAIHPPHPPTGSGLLQSQAHHLLASSLHHSARPVVGLPRFRLAKMLSRISRRPS